MSQMSDKRTAAQFDVTLERVQLQERIDSANDLARLTTAEERLVTALTAVRP